MPKLLRRDFKILNIVISKLNSQLWHSPLLIYYDEHDQHVTEYEGVFSFNHHTSHIKNNTSIFLSNEKSGTIIMAIT